MAKKPAVAEVGDSVSCKAGHKVAEGVVTEVTDTHAYIKVPRGVLGRRANGALRRHGEYEILDGPGGSPQKAKKKTTKKKASKK